MNGKLINLKPFVPKEAQGAELRDLNGVLYCTPQLLLDSQGSLGVRRGERVKKPNLHSLIEAYFTHLYLFHTQTLKNLFLFMV